MALKKKTDKVSKKKVTKKKEPKVKTFEYGDLAVVCKCGRTQIITKGIEHGLQLILSTREDSYIQLRCDECDADMKLCLLEGEKPAEEEKVNEGVQEESKQEQSL